MPELYTIKIINHRFHVDNNKGESGVGYDMIIFRDLMVQLGFTSKFKYQILHWDESTVHIMKPSNFLGKYDLTKREMNEVVMQTPEPAFT